MSVKLLTEHHLELILLKGGCTGSSEYTLVKMPHCWKSHVTAHMFCLRNKKIVFLLPWLRTLNYLTLIRMKMIISGPYHGILDRHMLKPQTLQHTVRE